MSIHLRCHHQAEVLGGKDLPRGSRHPRKRGLGQMWPAHSKPTSAGTGLPSVLVLALPRRGSTTDVSPPLPTSFNPLSLRGNSLATQDSPQALPRGRRIPRGWPCSLGVLVCVKEGGMQVEEECGPRNDHSYVCRHAQVQARMYMPLPLINHRFIWVDKHLYF